MINTMGIYASVDGEGTPALLRALCHLAGLLQPALEVISLTLPLPLCLLQITHSALQLLLLANNIRAARMEQDMAP